MIFVDTNVVSETMRKSPSTVVLDWIEANDSVIALPAVVVAEIAFGIRKIRESERAARLSRGLDAWRERYAGRIFSFDEAAAISYGEIMGSASRSGTTMSAPDGMIAAIVQANEGVLATRNVADFSSSGIKLVDPWVR